MVCSVLALGFMCIARWPQVGQQHQGWVKFFQDHVLSSMQCVWFNRGESSNRQVVAQKLSEHAKDPNRIPLLVFPEGTCVNNEHVVQFKKGVFELGVPICPIAMKYNKVFVDGYWNSRKTSFGGHLFRCCAGDGACDVQCTMHACVMLLWQCPRRLMTSWCVVCDVWFLDPQTQRADEDAVQFAGRVQASTIIVRDHVGGRYHHHVLALRLHGAVPLVSGCRS